MGNDRKYRMLFLNDEFRSMLRSGDPFDQLSAIEGRIFREVKGRKTLQFNLNGHSFFVKLHHGVGWREVFKNLFQLKMPILGAENEWQAIAKLKALGVDTMKSVAYGSRGWNPAKRQSFIVTEDLIETISLEDYCKSWKQSKPKFREKKQLIEKVAEISQLLHNGGVCHRDFYLCHFLLHQDKPNSDLDNTPKLSLIDLHRALIKRNLGQRWIVKDVAGLYFSAMDIGLTKADQLRFIRCYSKLDLRSALKDDGMFWTTVKNRAELMYKKLGSSN
ncbi:MAG: lipopolysaccharide core heptose(I) kinase RfaP [SAR86 cluster bacterium]|uniref:Lipopolysaccharide core heptose(I) kinase n=1 Tax=SAR86 cluster bacterium TaxID=2030880 RepID=A0A2A5B2X6_9GAMM|nr:MAG: lipopolysaccharide core heptose(I) kinase RfaP [SAR86 cluster bacterium]